MRTVRSVEESTFVPDVSVTLGVMMAIASLAVLIYFIHHISLSIQAEHLIAGAGHEFQRVLPLVFPERIGHGENEQQPEQDDLHALIDWRFADGVVTHRHGYIQRLDDAKLMQVACQHDLVVRLEHRPGDFVMPQARLLQVVPAGQIREEAEQQLRECYSFGPNRTPHQDVSYPLQQLVEIAVRALSPGINEPFTAMTCIDWLGASLASVLTRRAPSSHRYDEQGRLRVIAQPHSFAALVAVAFDQIRLYGHDNADVMVHLLTTMARLAPHLQGEGDRQVLLRYVKLIGLDAQQIRQESDRARVAQALRQAWLALSVRQPLADDNQT